MEEMDIQNGTAWTTAAPPQVGMVQEVKSFRVSEGNYDARDKILQDWATVSEGNYDSREKILLD